MKYLLLVLVLVLFSCDLFADEIELDLSMTEMQHSWRGPNNVGDFEGKMLSYGVTYWKDNGLGLRVAVGDAGFLESTGGKYSNLHIKMDKLVSVEILYRFYISNKCYLFGGVGQYYIPASAYSLDGNYVDRDRDDDNGVFVGAGCKISDHSSLSYRITEYSRVTSSPYDEWTRGHGLHVAYIF